MTAWEVPDLEAKRMRRALTNAEEEVTPGPLPYVLPRRQEHQVWSGQSQVHRNLWLLQLLSK